MSGILRASANPFAKDVPTRCEPRSPGPRVKATALTSSALLPAAASAWLTTGTMFAWWAWSQVRHYESIALLNAGLQSVGENNRRCNRGEV